MAQNKSWCHGYLYLFQKQNMVMLPQLLQRSTLGKNYQHWNRRRPMETGKLIFQCIMNPLLGIQGEGGGAGMAASADHLVYLVSSSDPAFPMANMIFILRLCRSVGIYASFWVWLLEIGNGEMSINWRGIPLSVKLLGEFCEKQTIFRTDKKSSTDSTLRH